MNSVVSNILCRRLALLVCSSLLASFTTPAHAGDKVAALAPVSLGAATSAPEDDAALVIQSKGKLTLRAYLAAVDKNFPGLAGAMDQREIASANRLEKQGVFDPLFSDESGVTRIQNTSHIGVPRTVVFNYPKLELPFRSGVRAFVQYRYNPESSQTPYIETGQGGELSGGVFVPLLRGLIYNEFSVAEKEAKLGEKLAAETFFLTRLDTLFKSGTIYWSWAGAKQKIDVTQEILDLANLVANISRQQNDRGDLARIYVTEAEEDVSRRQADLVQAQREFQRFSFHLSALLFDIGGTPLPLPAEINVPEMPMPEAISQVETDQDIQKAIGARPELKAIDVQLKIAHIDKKLAENQLLPAVNAVATEGHDYGYDGIGNVYRAQFTISEPLYLRTARGKLQAAKLRIDKLTNDRQAEVQRIRNEVLDAISAINLSYKRFAALEAQVDQANQVYLGERERFNMGDSTVFLVAERERQLIEAKLRTIDAAVEYHIGVLALKTITCQI